MSISDDYILLFNDLGDQDRIFLDSKSIRVDTFSALTLYLNG